MLTPVICNASLKYISENSCRGAICGQTNVSVKYSIMLMEMIFNDY